MNNQDKKEMLLMIARCAELADEKYYRGIGPMSEFVRLLRIRGQSMDFQDTEATDLGLPTDKPKREMPEKGEKYLVIEAYTFNIPFQLSKATWTSHTNDISLWKNGRAFLLSERELAEKKVAELNKILAS